VETVDFGSKGPVRCTRCKAYVNPNVRWTAGGQKFICNICEFPNDVEQEYFCHLDMNGQRADLMNRPELRCGAIDFAVTKVNASC
jgi:protein transport protein SEC24